MDAPTAEAPKKRAESRGKKAEPVVETTVAEVNAAPVAEESAPADAPKRRHASLERKRGQENRACPHHYAADR